MRTPDHRYRKIFFRVLSSWENEISVTIFLFTNCLSGALRHLTRPEPGIDPSCTQQTHSSSVNIWNCMNNVELWTSSNVDEGQTD